MTAQFKATSTHPLAKAIGSEIGIVINLGDKEVNVQFPIYGAEFSLGIENFDIKEGDIPLDVRPIVDPTPTELTQEDLKRIGEPYLGVQIPFDGDAQSAVVAITTQILADSIMGMNTFEGTTIHFANGSKLRVATKEEFLAFASWFSPKRQAFYQDKV
jgi:hypothetical protein